jgi:hypothetical protein
MTNPRPRSEDELVDLVRSIDVEAPPALHARVEEMVAAVPARGRLRPRSAAGRGGRRASPMRRARPLAGALATVVVVAGIIVTLTSGGSTRNTLSLRSAAAPTLLAATTAAPSRSDHSQYLKTAVGDVRFPYLEDALGWRASGARTDAVDGRAVTTVFSSRGAQRVGYAIYAGVPSTSWGGASVSSQGGTKFHILSGSGTAIISWTRSGHLCVMASHGASAEELIRLAGWGGSHTVAA